MQIRSNYRLTEQQKHDAREAYKLLKGTDTSLVDIARHYLQVRPSLAREDISLSDAVDRFIDSKLTENLRPATMRYYANEMTVFVRDFGASTPLYRIRRDALLKYLERLDMSAASVSCRFRAIRAFFRWALSVEPPLITRDGDPTIGLKFRPRRPKRGKNVPTFFHPDTVSTIIKNCDEKFLPSLALMFFAGIRPAEIRGLEKPPLKWEHIDVDRKELIIPANAAKTGFARLLDTLPDNLWEILEPFYDMSGNVCPTDAIRSAVDHAKKLLKDHEAAESWTQDVARHTFATYHVFKFRDPGLTSMILGHQGNQDLLFKHYRGVPIQGASDMATQFFSIVR